MEQMDRLQSRIGASVRCSMLWQGEFRMLVQTSSDVEWRPMRERRFLVAWDLDIDAAKRFVEETPRRVRQFSVNKFCSDALVPEVEDRTIFGSSFRLKTVDWTRVRADTSIDLDIPIILWTYQKGGVTNVPIDGWHRIAKALTVKIDSLPCVVLSRRESAVLAKEGRRH
ncbi:MAG: hypothetical protein HY908_09760 [Myxococcales bacterium]|nr:hypothetical protein [Myxococcales bacterium]